MGENDFFQKRSVWALSLFVGASLLVWWNPAGFFQPLSGVVSTLTLPFQNALAWGAFELSDVQDFFSSIGTLKKENAQLKKENQALVAEAARLRDQANENTHLRALVELKKERKEKLVSSEIIGREGTGSATLVTINRGTVQGIASGMPVVSAGGVLVGRVEASFPGTARVRLLPHPESLVSATLAATDSNGVVRGEHGLGMVFDLALQSDSLKPGEAVVTSGLGDNFPRGLLIGTIESVRPSVDRLFQVAVIVSPLSFDTLRFVSVIVDEKP